VNFVNVAKESGLKTTTIFGGEHENKSLLETKLLYRNLRNGKFEDISEAVGPGISMPSASRGCAFGDFDNDGDIDFVVNCVNEAPQSIRCDSSMSNNWIKVRTIGVKSNRSGIGRGYVASRTWPGKRNRTRRSMNCAAAAAISRRAILRVHFGLEKTEKVDLLEIRWPSGTVDTLKDLKANQLVFVKEGEGIVRKVSSRVTDS
jgi:hypothetical protein